MRSKGKNDTHHTTPLIGIKIPSGAHEFINIIVCFHKYYTMFLKYHSNLFSKTYYVLYDKLLCFILKLVISFLKHSIFILQWCAEKVRSKLCAMQGAIENRKSSKARPVKV